MIPMSFHLDCGEVLAGHRLIATGIRVDGLSNDRAHADYSEHAEGKPVHSMVSLTYRITPALPENDGGRRDIYATVRLDPPADPSFWDEVFAPGAERDVTPDATNTEAAVGPFICPDSTEKVTVHLVEAAIITSSGRASSGAADRDLGEVIVDLPTMSARWQPAARPDLPRC